MAIKMVVTTALPWSANSTNQAPNEPKDPPGKETQMCLAGDVEAVSHGQLTSWLCSTLGDEGSRQLSYAGLERALQKRSEQSVTVRLSDACRDRIVMESETHATADLLLAQLDAWPVRSIIANLMGAIERRAQQGDYWPEGRLNLGIAYAAIGEYANARHWLEDAVNIIEHPSYVPRSEQMAV